MTATQRNGSAAPAGLERKLLKRIPHLFLAGTLLPLCFFWYFNTFPNPQPGVELEKYLTGLWITCLAIVITVWTFAFTLAIGCFIVIIMKGPGYVADGYELPDADQPASSDPDPNPGSNSATQQAPKDE